VKFEITVKKEVLKLRIFCNKRKKMFGSWITPLVGRHVVNDSKIADNVGCHVVNEPRVAYDVVLR